ncbi:hypothetical protein BJ741DRAFT_20181 [Chytriomyces cf. hyalinus JEL632]|nr:hypothetical protein BJ741DRAFT_20181 [Chytriomyces cf. hyalinus JEL632]
MSQQQQPTETSLKALPYVPQEGASDSPAGADSSLLSSVTLDHLGPIVVGTDGSMQRISNWDKLTPSEQANTMRVISKRNNARLEKLRAEMDTTGEQAAKQEEL